MKPEQALGLFTAALALAAAVRSQKATRHGAPLERPVRFEITHRPNGLFAELSDRGTPVRFHDLGIARIDRSLDHPASRRMEGEILTFAMARKLHVTQLRRVLYTSLRKAAQDTRPKPTSPPASESLAHPDAPPNLNECPGVHSPLAAKEISVTVQTAPPVLSLQQLLFVDGFVNGADILVVEHGQERLLHVSFESYGHGLMHVDSAIWGDTGSFAHEILQERWSELQTLIARAI